MRGHNHCGWGIGENLAYLAAAPAHELRASSRRLGSRYARIQRELDAVERQDAEHAAFHFAETEATRPPLSHFLQLHAEHLRLLGAPESATLSQLAECCEQALHGADAFFLNDVDVRPSQPPPCSSALNELRALRRSCAPASFAAYLAGIDIFGFGRLVFGSGV